jgi:hypothetical protein
MASKAEILKIALNLGIIVPGGMVIQFVACVTLRMTQGESIKSAVANCAKSLLH